MNAAASDHARPSEQDGRLPMPRKPETSVKPVSTPRSRRRRQPVPVDLRRSVHRADAAWLSDPPTGHHSSFHHRSRPR
jgi:hypothetical protein